MKTKYYKKNGKNKWSLLLLLTIIFPNLIAQTYTKEERMYWNSALWKDVSTKFHNPEHLRQINWDSLYISNITRAIESQSDLEYYRLLEESLAVLNDGHTNLYIDKSILFSDDYKIDFLPMDVQAIGEYYYVLGIWKEKANEIPLYSKILEINGMTTFEYLQKHIFPYIPAQTIQDRKRKSLEYLLSGKPNDSITFTIQTPQGEIFKIALQYAFNINNLSKRDMFVSRFAMRNKETSTYLNNDFFDKKYYYLRLDGFDSRNITGLIKSIAEDVSKAEYVILDLRNNGGGYETEADTLLSCFLDIDTLITYPSRTRIDDAYYAAMGYGYPEYKDYYNGLSVRILPLDTIIKKDLPLFTQPLFILTSTKTYSAAEDLLITMKLNYPNRAILVGTPTGGSTGAPFVRRLPYHNAYYRICVRRPLLPEGLYNDGIQPDYLYEPDINELLGNKDLIDTYVAKIFSELKR